MSRSSYNPRYPRRSAYGGPRRQFRRPTVDEAALMKGLAPTPFPVDFLAEMEKPPAAGEIKISDVDLLASFNWVGTSDTRAPNEKPTIMVPGSPVEWINKQTPFNVNLDESFPFIYQNAYHFPNTPALPMIAAVKHLRPDFPLGTVDIITPRNNLRKLLRWIDGETARDNSFRIDIQLLGEKTVSFRRWEVQSSEVGAFGYGHNFEKASTRPAEGCEGTSGHHRVIAYDFNGLKMMLGYELDACLPQEKDESAAETSSPKASARAGASRTKPGKKPVKATDVDDLLSGLDKLSIDRSAESSSETVDPKSNSKEFFKTSTLEAIAIVPGGRLVPKEQTIELTTRSLKNFTNFTWKDPYNQVLLSQTQYLYVAVHQSGRFDRVYKYELGTGMLKSVEKQATESIGKLRRLLDVIVGEVLKSGKGELVTLVCKGGELKMYKRVDGSRAYPDDLEALFHN